MSGRRGEPLSDIIEAFLLLCAAPPLSAISVSVESGHAASHAHTHTAFLQSGKRLKAGQFISDLTVRLRGALRLHQFTQQTQVTAAERASCVSITR